jgi:hypothetical protein
MTISRGIVWIDMHLRDTRVLEYLCDRAARNGGTAQIMMIELAEHFSCHRNTARNIVERLVGAEHIVINARLRHGYQYSVNGAQ